MKEKSGEKKSAHGKILRAFREIARATVTNTPASLINFPLVWNDVGVNRKK